MIHADLQRIFIYERDAIWPTMELIVRIAKVFEVSVDYLIRDDGELPGTKIRIHELFKYLEEFDHLPKEAQKFAFSLLDSFTKRRKFEELIQT